MSRPGGGASVLRAMLNAPGGSQYAPLNVRVLFSPSLDRVSRYFAEIEVAVQHRAVMLAGGDEDGRLSAPEEVVRVVRVQRERRFGERGERGADDGAKGGHEFEGNTHGGSLRQRGMGGKVFWGEGAASTALARFAHPRRSVGSLAFGAQRRRGASGHPS